MLDRLVAAGRQLVAPPRPVDKQVALAADRVAEGVRVFPFDRHHLLSGHGADALGQRRARWGSSDGLAGRADFDARDLTAHLEQFERNVEALRHPRLQGEIEGQPRAAGVDQHTVALADLRAGGVVGGGGQRDVGVSHRAAVAETTLGGDLRQAEGILALDQRDILDGQIGINLSSERCCRQQKKKPDERGTRENTMKTTESA